MELPERGIARGQALREIARTVVLQAMDGNSTAWQEVGNRLDGKPVATTEVSGPNGKAIELAGLPWNHVEPAPPEDR